MIAAGITADGVTLGEREDPAGDSATGAVIEDLTRREEAQECGRGRSAGLITVELRADFPRVGRAALAAVSMAEDSAEAASTAVVVDAGSDACGVELGARDAAEKPKRVRACVAQDKS